MLYSVGVGLDCGEGVSCVCVCVGSTNSVVRGSVGCFPYGGVQVLRGWTGKC